ncbi:MAG: glycosyltransferase [Desulfovibrio sp.]|nr:glycosyltransferase [Desulfovibrio sp.]
MLGSLIRNFSRIAYRHPVIPENREGKGAFGKLKIALLADYFTAACLAEECRIRYLTPRNYREILSGWKPDLVFVESVFHGVDDGWRFRLGKQPHYLKLLPSNEIRDLALFAGELDIPAIFWNKDDKAFFDFFLDAASNFKYVFTTDSDCVPRYKEKLPPGTEINVLAMPYQPAFHNFTGFAFESREACFVGSYYRKILRKRRDFLNMIFEACDSANFRLNVYDRNSSRVSHFFEFKYPVSKAISLHKGVPYARTGELYKKFSCSINANSITDSPTMVSRRLLEILACGGICVTNANPAVKRHFSRYCHIADSYETAKELFERLSRGPNQDDLEKAEAGARYVAAYHTWERRLEQLEDTINF